MFRKWLCILCALGFTVSIIGCASVTVKSGIKYDDIKTEGVRYYQPEPYLLVTQEVPKASPSPKDKPEPAASIPNYQVQLIFLPNYTKGYTITVASGFGTAHGSAKLANGWQLIEFGGITDSKIPETIAAFSGLVTGAATGILAGAALKDAGQAFAAANDKDKIVLLPGLYRLVFDAQTGYFVSLVPVMLFPLH